MDFQKLYEEKKITPAQAAEQVQSGMKIASDIALSNPYLFYEAVADRVRKGELKDIEVNTLLNTQTASFHTDPELAKNMRGVSWFSGVPDRKAVNAGIMDIRPCAYRDVPVLFKEYVKPDIYCAVVSPMDKHGYFSTGGDHSASEALLQTASKVFLQVNPNMPRSLSSLQINVKDVDGFWEDDAPMPENPPAKIDETSRKIGAYIAEEIPDGATLQLGIGGVPDAVAQCLKDHQHLGCHTEMFTNSMVDLIEAGVVDNSRKELDWGVSVCTFAYGSRKMYDFIDDNPGFKILPVNYVNSPNTIRQFKNFISINAAVEVDFFGQVCAESLGTKHISGTGGQQDFVRGAVLSEGGKSFIAFPSTAAGGKVSRIVPTLSPGAQVSTGKNDVDCIVTEYGIAQLRGRSLSERAKALISIAHPKFRDMLTAKAREENIII